MKIKDPIFVKSKKNIAIVIALLFYSFFAIGILFSSNNIWFLQHSNISILVMLFLLIFTQPGVEKFFFLFIIIASVIAFFANVATLNLSFLFNNKTYGNSMGPKLLGSPILIGLHWFIIVYCCGSILHYVNSWSQKKLIKYGKLEEISIQAKSISLIVDAGLLAIFFDYIIEPAAQKLNWWQWENNMIPYFNYSYWFFISCLLLLILNQLNFNKLNPFALHLFIIQLLFFITLRIHL